MKSLMEQGLRKNNRSFAINNFHMQSTAGVPGIRLLLITPVICTSDHVFLTLVGVPRDCLSGDGYLAHQLVMRMLC